MSAQPLVLLYGPAHQILVDALEKPDQHGWVETPVVVIQPRGYMLIDCARSVGFPGSIGAASIA